MWDPMSSEQMFLGDNKSCGNHKILRCTREKHFIERRIAKRLITIAVTGTEEDDDNGDDDNEALVYVKELKKKLEWLKDTLESETRNDTIIETLDTDCENVESLKKFRY